MFISNFEQQLQICNYIRIICYILYCIFFNFILLINQSQFKAPSQVSIVLRLFIIFRKSVLSNCQYYKVYPNK